MGTDPLEPSVSPPPRPIEAWTHVPGHEVIARPGRHTFCSCGARAREGEDAQVWRTTHLREAWPILVPRLDGETYAHWMERVSDAHAAAARTELGEFEANGGAREIAPGEPYPVISAAYEEASDRVLVLQHQLDEILPRVMRERGSGN